MLESIPKDIGILIPEIVRDLDEEEGDYIKEKLYNCYMKDIRRASIAGVAEWYKEKLLENLKEE